VAEEFIGAGWAFPMAVDASGSVALVRRERELEDSIRLIVATAPGERPMRPEFGCGIHDFVFAPADATTAGRIAYEVRASIDRWEPRVDVVNVDVTSDPSDASTLFIEVTYAVRGTNDPRNLVFPFYVIPSEEPEP
jgi:phage baseplate assembly protein W